MSNTNQPSKLDSSGIRRLVQRHPRYLGLVIMVAGFALVFRAWVGLAADAILLVALLWRISDEEQLLRRGFGEAWDAYARRTWRLMPTIW